MSINSVNRKCSCTTRAFFTGLPGLLVVLTSAASGQTPNIDAPVWSGIMLSGQAVEYYKYTNGSRTEISVENSSLATLQSTSRPPYTYQFSGIPGPNQTERTVCQIVNQTDPNHPVYWCDANNQPITGFPKTNPTEFHESRNETGIKGLEFLGTFSSDGPISGGNAALEVVFFTDRRCADAGREYGFFKDLVTGQIKFYYSDYTNCEGNVCRLHSDCSTPHGPLVDDTTVIANLQPGSQGMKFYYHAYLVPDSTAPHGYKFRVEVVDPNQSPLAQCTNPATGALDWCTRDIIPHSWFLADQVNSSSGWVIAGIQNAGFSTVPNNPSFYVETVKVGK